MEWETHFNTVFLVSFLSDFFQFLMKEWVKAKGIKLFGPDTHLQSTRMKH
jgi:hypothetical protein